MHKDFFMHDNRTAVRIDFDIIKFERIDFDQK